jgi:Tol biopolymer transport system component
MDPRWAPDGSFLAFSAIQYPAGASQIYIVGPDGSHPVQLTHAESGSVSPSPSPDGLRIVFVRWLDSPDGPIGSHLMMVDSDGTDETLFMHEWNTYFEAPQWSPVGDWIAYSKMLAYRGFDIYIARADGSAEIRLTDSPHTYKGHVAWRLVRK